MELWSSAHVKTLLPALAVMIVIALALRAAIGHKELKIRMIPFQVLSCILLVLEVGKQILSFRRGYDLYHIPLHFCSLFIFAMPLMSFYRGKHRQTVAAVTSTLCASVFLLLLIYPCLIYSATDIQNFFTDYFPFHTVAFHNIVMFACVLIVALDLHTPAPKGEPKAVILFTLCFCAAAGGMAQLLKTNFANFYSCNIPPLEELRLTMQGIIGSVPTQLLYIALVALAHVLFVLLSYWAYRSVRHLTAAKAPRAARAVSVR